MQGWKASNTDHAPSLADLASNSIRELSDTGLPTLWIAEHDNEAEWIEVRLQEEEASKWKHSSEQNKNRKVRWDDPTMNP